MTNRVRRNCTDDSEFVRARSEYSNYLSRADHNISSIDNAFQVKLANAPTKQKWITSFIPTYHPVISEIHKIICKHLRSAVDSSELLKEILPLDTIKFS